MMKIVVSYILGVISVVVVFLFVPRSLNAFKGFSDSRNLGGEEDFVNLEGGGVLSNNGEDIMLKFGEHSLGAKVSNGVFQKIYFADFEKKWMLIDDNCDGVWDRRKR